MNETMMTIVGNVVDSPKLRRTRSGHSVANFRVASTPRRFNRETNQWEDAGTLFISVTAWRALGENTALSLHRGQPVIVSGRYYQREYKQDEQIRTAYELEAMAVGHDLSRGVSSFEKVNRPALSTLVETDAEGIPEDRSDHYLDLDDGAPVIVDGVEVDPETGEVRELTAAG